MISIRKQIEHADYLAACFRALLKAYLGLAKSLPTAALPANPDLAAQCKEDLERSAAALKDTPPVEAIDEAGKLALQRIDDIFHSNRAALEERDTALKEVVASVAQAMAGFRGHGERHESNLGRLADNFEALSRVEDATELRRRLRENVSKLREAAEEMRHGGEQATRQFESQISAFQQRLEMARKESGTDRLTGLGSRQEAERQVRSIPRRQGTICVLLFDIEGFKDINQRYGALFGDKLLCALAHVLRGQFPEEGSLFRWGADEFLVICEGSLAGCAERSRGICASFSTGGKYFTTSDSGAKIDLAAGLAFGAAQYASGESPEELCRRSRAALDQNRRQLRR
jgi:diguanylate cyclase (GGDEF)-like protein